jgi:hypothetical protein
MDLLEIWTLLIQTRLKIYEYAAVSMSTRSRTVLNKIDGASEIRRAQICDDVLEDLLSDEHQPHPHILKVSTHSRPVDLPSHSHNNQSLWKLRGAGCTQSAVCQPGRGKRTSQYGLSLIPNLQIPLLDKPTRKPLNLQPGKRSIQIPLREIIPSLSGSNKHLQLDTTCSVALHSSGSEFRAKAVDVVDDVRLETLSYMRGKVG